MENRLVPGPSLMQSIAAAHARLEARGDRVTPVTLITQTIYEVSADEGAEEAARRYGVELAVLGYQAELAMARGDRV